MINQKESKQVPTTVMIYENKSKKTKINQQTIIKIDKKLKSNRKIKALGNITSTIDHYLRNG